MLLGHHRDEEDNTSSKLQNPFKNADRRTPGAHRPDSANSKAGKVGIKKTLDRQNGDAIELQERDLGLVQRESSRLAKGRT